jgi:hypothetical protein
MLCCQAIIAFLGNSRLHYTLQDRVVVDEIVKGIDLSKLDKVGQRKLLKKTKRMDVFIRSDEDMRDYLKFRRLFYYCQDQREDIAIHRGCGNNIDVYAIVPHDLFTEVENIKRGK